MHNLLEFLERHHHWFLFIILEAISLTLLFSYNGYQGSVWFSSANALAGKVYAWSSAVESYFSLTKVNEDLTLRNYYLERQVTQLRRLYTEATQEEDPQERNGLDSLSRYQLIPAKVVTNELDRNDNLMTIDKGKADGVEVGMGVACGRGVVGVTYLVSSHYSIVIPVLNSHSSREDIPRHARFKRGDWVETNGYSSIFPPGVLVGQIVEVYNSRDGLSYKLKVRLTTDFGNLRDVVVISDRSIAARMRLMQSARDSLKLNVKE